MGFDLDRFRGRSPRTEKGRVRICQGSLGMVGIAPSYGVKIQEQFHHKDEDSHEVPTLDIIQSHNLQFYCLPSRSAL